MSAAPDVSVVIPTRNRARYLPSALASALGQEGVEVEAIAVDDASDDETPSLLAGYGDPRVRTVRFESRRGQMDARNAGVEAARAPWLAFLDDDDLWAPAKLRRQLEEARRAGATWAYCGVFLIGHDGDVTPIPADPRVDGLLERLLQRNVVQAGASTLLVEAERFHAVGGFEDDLNNPWDILIRLAAAGPPAVAPEPLAAYRRHSASYITKSRATALADARAIAAKHRGLAQGHGVELDLEEYRRWLDSELVRGLRTEALRRRDEGRRAAAARLQLGAFARSRSWRDLRRLGRIVAGERARTAVRRAVPAKAPATSGPEVPDWLARQLREAP